MDRRQLDVLVPVLFGLAVVVSALLVEDALVYVAVIGAILVGIYFAVFRRSLAAPASGRQRDRRRHRGT